MLNTEPDARMRVLFVLPRMVAGGVERATLNLIDGLQRRAIPCQLALGSCRGELLDEVVGTTSVIDLGAGRHLSRWLCGLRRAIRGFEPTHVVTAFADVSLLTLIAMKLAGSPAALVIGIHGTQRRDAISGSLGVRVRFVLHAWLARYVYAHADALVAVSQGVAGDLRGKYPAVADRVITIYSPILRERPSARSEASRVRRLPREIVAVGRLAFEKGFDVLVRAMPIVLASVDVRLAIHGEGVERLRLQQQIKDLGLEGKVQLMGATLDPMGAISGADLFVFPSRNEGFGIALVEALACGLQIVASDCFHGPAEILAEGHYGQLVPPGDVTGLAAAIVRSLRGEVTFDRDGLARHAAEFSADEAVSRYLSLLNRLRSGSRGRAATGRAIR